MKTISAQDYYGMSTKVLKKIGNEIAEHLDATINMIFSKDQFPNEWKISLVMPVYKKVPLTDTSSYRPIAQLPTVSHVFEHALKIRVIRFLGQHSILDKEQHGFRTGRSTKTLLNLFHEEIMKGLEGK